MTITYHKDTNKSQNLPTTWDNLFCLPKFVSCKMMKMVNLYFDKYIGAPLAYSFFPAQYSLGNQLVEEGYNIALIGVKSEMNAGNPGSESAPDAIRQQLYALRGGFKQTKIADLGNLKLGKSLSDTYSALKCVVGDLLDQKIIPIVIGGSHELTYPIFEGMKEKIQHIRTTMVDCKMDYPYSTTDVFEGNTFAKRIIDDNQTEEFKLLGYQGYFCPQPYIDKLEGHRCLLVRAGSLFRNIMSVEPLLRDTDLLSIDMSAIRHADSPGYARAISNGLSGEEICQIAHYAGLSDSISAFGLFEANPTFDNSDQTASLAAQIIWHFIEGVDNRYGDYPVKDIKKYQERVAIFPAEQEENIHFFVNRSNGRWWIKIPTKSGDKIYACNEADYRSACEGDLPYIWMRHFMN